MSRRFQFSLRTLLVVTTVIGGPCAWVAYNTNLVRQRNAMRSGFRSGFSVPGASCFLHRVADQPLGPGHPLPWLRRALGDKPVQRLLYMPDRDPDGSELRRAEALFPETEIGVVKIPPGPFRAYVRTGPMSRAEAFAAGWVRTETGWVERRATTTNSSPH